MSDNDQEELEYLQDLHKQVMRDLRSSIRIMQQASFDTLKDVEQLRAKVARLQTRLEEMQRQVIQMCQHIQKLTLADDLARPDAA